MTQQYILYGSPDSANLVVRMLLHELGQPFESVWLDRSRREHKQADYLAMNPQGLIPVLVDNGQPIFETAAITLHLCDKHGLLAPQSGADRARFLQWLFYLSNTAHADLRVRFYCNDYIDGETAQAALRAGVGQRFKHHLQLIEAELAANDGGPWFLGESLSALDIYLAALCRWWQLYPTAEAGAPISAQALPNLFRLLSELARRPAIAAACAEESIVAPFFIDPKLPGIPQDMITG
jgi:glutathione S-transferase